MPKVSRFTRDARRFARYGDGVFDDKGFERWYATDTERAAAWVDMLGSEFYLHAWAWRLGRKENSRVGQ